MFNCHDKKLKAAGGFIVALCAAFVLGVGSAEKASAQIPPPNDNLTNAQPLLGPTGTVIGTNINATAESNEPPPFPGNPAQASIWYLWTAPYNSTIDFNTRGSVDPNTGNQLDTVLAVYQLTGTPLAFSNLTLVTNNDDDPSGGVVSRVDVPVTVGTTYLIQVDGSTNTPSGLNAQGIVVLNWQPSLVGGTFGFTTGTYFAGELDDILPVDFGGDPMAPSLHNQAGQKNVRVTVTRTGGYQGKCQVTLTMTNAFYFNFYQTNLSGTNIYTTNYSSNGMVMNWTNTFETNVQSEGLLEDYIDQEGIPGLVQLPSFGFYQVTQTNTSTQLFPPFTNDFNTPNGPQPPAFNLTNYFPIVCTTLWITNTTTNSGATTISITQLFCTNITTNLFIPAASNTLDYVAVNTNLFFNDFQMSQDIYVQINPAITLLAGPDWPDVNGDYNYYGINSVVLMGLTNAALVPGEDLDVVPPTINPNSAAAYLDILNFGGNPNNHLGGGYYLSTNGPLPTIANINIERATFRINKGSPTAYLYVLLTGSFSATATYQCHYAIDCPYLYNAPPEIPIGSFNWDGFPTVANSDYAQPEYFGVTNGADFGNPINQPPDPSGLNVGGNTTWPDEAPYIGKITFPPFSPGVGEIAIPITNSGAVAFDMDCFVQIFETPDDASANESATFPGGLPAPAFLGNIQCANMTINFNPQAGGANDTTFNVDGVPASYPPDNPVPGANGGAVRAVAIQANGQSIIGGYFSSYNTTPIYGVARLLPNGLLDTTYNQVTLPGVNYGGYVNAVVIDSSGRAIIGGNFLSYDGNAVVNIARLNSDGSLDKSFVSGTGFNGVVNCLYLDTNGNILVGGDFTSYNTTNCNYIARLLPTGGLDPAFVPNTGNGLANFGCDAQVQSISSDLFGNIVLGGDFQYVDGSNLVYVARMLPNGAVDSTFNPEIGPDDTVYSVAVKPNNEVLIAGAFQNVDLYPRGGVAALNFNGSVDQTFLPGTGDDGGIVYSLLLQPDGNIMVAGQFRSFNSSRRVCLARLLPSGWVDTSFMDTAYNQFAGLADAKFYSDTLPICYATALQPDGNILIGGSFTNVGGGGTRSTIHTKINVARIIGLSNPGPMTGGGGIGNQPGNITFTQNPYTVDDTASGLFVTIQRENGSLGPAQITLTTNTFTPGPGSATPADFGVRLPDVALFDILYNIATPVPLGVYGWREGDGFYGLNTGIQPEGDNGESALNIAIHDDLTALQNLSAGLATVNINSQGLLQLGGVPIPMYPAYGVNSVNLEIINDNFPPGFVGFAQTNFIAIDTSNSVTISVLRTNGTFNPITVYYYTSNGTAISGLNYTGTPSPSSKTELTFNGGSAPNIATFSIPITPQSTVQNTKFFNIVLTQPNPASVLDTNVPPVLPITATVTIIDGNFAPGHLDFISPTYSALKGGVATIGVQRLGGALGQLSVQVSATNGTNSTPATNGLNFVGVTNTLVWTNQDSSIKTFTVQTLQDKTVDGPRTVNLSLFNATNIGGSGSNNLILSSPSNATLTILESDSYGNINFAAANFNILQNAGQALITVVRTNGATGTVTVNYTTFNDTNVLSPYQAALAGTNYSVANGTLVFTNGVTSQSFLVPIIYTPGESSPANRVVSLELFNGSPGAITNQLPVFATLTILDNQLVLNPAGSVDLTTQNGSGFNGPVNSLALQPDGSVLAGGQFTFFNNYPFNYIARLTPAGAFDTNFLFNMAGANNYVFDVLSQTPGKTQINGPVTVGGQFSQLDTAARGGVGRLNVDGSIDETFNPSSGADNTIYSIAETFLPAAITNQPATIAYYVGGNFANIAGVSGSGIARLNGSTNSLGYPGEVDLNFNVGQGVTGSNAFIRAVAVEPNNQVVAAGDFTAFNGVTYNHLIRLNVDGSVDTSFNAGTEPDNTGSIRAVAVQADGKIVIGGLFTNVNGVNYSHLARLNSDGSLDGSFNVGVGGDGSVLALAIDTQQRILVGGEFSHFSGVTRSGITRLNPDGTVDPTINFQSGADGGAVDAIVVQANDEIDLGGSFSTFERVSENNFVRVYGGANTGDGTVQFTQPVFGVLESSSNALITIQRLGGEGTATLPTVTITFSTSDNTAVAGTDYTNVTTNLVFPLGETFEIVSVPLIPNTVLGSNKIVNLTLSNPVNGALGAQSTAQLVITNVNTAISFGATSFNQSANQSNAIIPIVRSGFAGSVVGISVYTGTNGSAAPSVNYIPTSNFIVFNPGVMTNYFLVPLINASNMFSDLTVDLEMTAPSNAYIGAPSSATLTIDSVFNGPGALSFAQTNFSVSEGGTNAAITIVRSNGSFGTVSVTLSTSNLTALAGLNYTAVTTNVTFNTGEVSKTVYIPVIQQSPANAGPDVTVLLTLSNPQNTTIAGPTQETLIIQNDIEDFYFLNTPYFVSEGAGTVTVDITRGGPLTNAATVNYTTYTPPNVSESNGYALPNIDYVPASGTLTFAPNVSFTTIPIGIVQNNVVNGPLQFQVLLNTPSPAGTYIGNPGTASVTILSDVTGFSLSTNAYSVAENGSNLVVWVNRINPATGSASVQFSTADGTAVNQVDYVGTNGTLTFLDGQASNSFVVPILNPNIVENAKTFTVALSNPKVLTFPNPSTNAFLISPSNATVTITNILTGVSFGAPSFTVSECAFEASIPVVLTGATNNLVTVTASTTNGGSAAQGANYFPATQSFTFLPGQTSTNFLVQVNNNHVIGPDHTVVMNLYGVQGTNAQLINPSTAILTIQECNGAYIVKSGTAFVSGNMSPAGSILSNETVTVLFGLRDVAGNNTTNLTATLLATNGVTNVSAAQNYGALITGGPTVSRPFTFTALGSNGQTIVANFTLKDGSQVYSNVAFGFTIGGTTATFSTNEVLHLSGVAPLPAKAYNTNSPNFGYPSQINVQGVVGNVTALNVGISNFGHSYPANVTMVVESPGGQSTYLMSDCGGSISNAHVNLTFSQNASVSLPKTTAMTSGTYLPTSYASTPLALTNGAPPGPYPTTLGQFTGVSPNGIWSLFVVDEDTLDSGYISNGWNIVISTGVSVEEDADLGLSMSSTPSAATLGNALTYTVNVTNYGPANATNIVITDVLPAGASYVSNSCSCVYNTNGVLTYTASTLAVGSGLSFSFSVIPNALGYLTNVATATSDEVDPNDNYVQTNISLVGATSADLGVTLGEVPNPVLDGATVTYTIVVTNNGPSAATGVTAVNTLPNGFLPTTLTPSQGAATNVNGVITWNVGTLSVGGAGSRATMTIVAGVGLPSAGLPSSANLDSVSVSSSVYDPAKLNNFASVKTQVLPSSITVTPNGTSTLLSWPASGNTVLQGAVTLTGPWVAITNSSIVPQIIGGQTYDTFTPPGTNGYHYFRLQSQVP